jgi:hypothetical protein
MLANLYHLGYEDAAQAARGGPVQLQMRLDGADDCNENVHVPPT